jgi:DNA polymerase/3'-5' exonuclease PolX
VVVNQWHKVKGEPTGKYTQRVLPGGVTLDLFIVEPDSWGWQLCLRTGSTEFNRDVILKAMHQQGYDAAAGQVRKLGKIIPLREEADVFALLKVPWVEPSAREV